MCTDPADKEDQLNSIILLFADRLFLTKWLRMYPADQGWQLVQRRHQ
jgi:hypothetical protein